MPHTPSKNHPSSSSGSHLHLVKPPLSLRSSGRERVQQIAERCGGGRERHGTWLVCCPAHDDHHPSLVITPDDSKVLLYCRSQHCTAEAICTALGLTLGELFVSDRPTRQEPVASVPVPPRLPPDERNRGALSRRYVESCPLTAGDPVLTYLGLQALLKVNLRLATTDYLSNGYDGLESGVTLLVLLPSTVASLSAYEATYSRTYCFYRCNRFWRPAVISSLSPLPKIFC